MNIYLGAAAGGVMLLSATVARSAHAVNHMPSQMTCEEFTGLTEVEKPKIVYWVDGFGKGKMPDSAVEVDKTDKLLPVLIGECKKTPSETLSMAIRSVAPRLATASKPTAQPKRPIEPKPTKMSCDEFIAMDDVVRPKVVYWAEGFDKGGKAGNSVVDLDATDRLIPLLVKECRDTPKLGLWQKLQKLQKH